MFIWLEKLLGNSSETRWVQTETKCGCGCDKSAEEVLSDPSDRIHYDKPTYSCTMPGDVTATSSAEEEEKEETPFTVSMYIPTRVDPIIVENAIDWDFLEDRDTGKVTIDVYPKEGEVQVFIFLRGQLSYATAI